MRPTGSCRRASAPFLLLSVLAWSLAAQQGSPPSTDVAAQLAAARARLAVESYTMPPEAVARLVTAPRHLNISVTMQSPDRRHFIKQESEGLPTAAVFAKPHLKFAGLQVDPAANRVRTMTTRGSAGLQLIDARTGEQTTVTVPAGASVSGPSWSPDGNQLAFIANFETNSHVYVADVATGRSRQVTRTPLLATLVSSLEWATDNRHLVVVLLPASRGAAPVAPAVAIGPQVQLWTDGQKSPQRMHASLMEWPHDFAQMEYYTTGQLAVINTQSRAVRTVGTPAMIRSVSVSPDGQYFRVTTMQKPFSYMVPWSQFGTKEEIWDAHGTVLAELQDRPLREAPDTTTGDGPGGGQGAQGPNARRGLSWMPQGPGLYYLQSPPAARGADSANAAPAGGAGQGGQSGSARADRLVHWLPPFGDADTSTIYHGDGPIASVVFSDDARTLFVATNRSGTGEIFAVRLDQPETKLSILRQRAWVPAFAGVGGGGGFGGGGGGGQAGANDSLAFYGNPGSFMTRPGTHGGTVALVSGSGAVYFSGTRYHPDWQAEAPRAFVDRVMIGGGEKTRIFEGAPGMVESVSAVLDDDFQWALVTRESPDQVPDTWLRNMATGALTRLTSNVDQTPEFTKLRRERVWVARPDGIRFLANVTLPADYREGTRLPGMFWFYPYEFTNQAGYDRRLRTENVNRFPASGPRSIEFMAMQGYVVANFNPPIIGEQGRMNDNYISDLRMNLLAVIDELDSRGWIDRQRLGLGGHSYGAFSTANAMVSMPSFRAGIAGAGMYNRTLTPNGFQSERRDLWSGQSTYLDLSAMLNVDKLQGALLLYHGMDDQNVGTNPISSVRMMQALRAQGKTSALYMYPYEDHGPATRESLLDLWARWTAWLDIYVKHHGVTPSTPATVADLTP
ncbi:MAG TPA: prolyl oligopeptidase family serine peptidase [Gemmatimonadales bacterium]|nr:prolyl oligopeptidase family serine peptidase [Gemmatimonadales bacterium]